MTKGIGRLRDVSSDQSSIEGSIEDTPALIPPGDYIVKVVDWHTVLLFGKRPKLCIVCQVVDVGEYFGTKLCRWYNVKRLKGKTGRRGGFSAGWSSDCVREYVTLSRQVVRPDRIAISDYFRMLIVAKVVTVTSDREQRDIPEPLQYSVVKHFLRLEAEGRKAA